MRGGTLGRRYARALLALAAESGEVDKLGKDLADFAEMWESSRDLRDVFENPSFSSEARRQVVEALAAKASISPLLTNALRMLSDRRRLRQLASIAEAYAHLAEQQSGKIRAEVTTATPMPDAYFAQLEKVLAQTTGKQVVLIKKHDPSLIAGVVTRVGDQVFDGSVKNQLNELRDELLSR